MTAAWRRPRAVTVRVLIALATLALVGLGVAVGVSGASARSSALTRSEVASACAGFVNHDGGRASIQLFGRLGGEERIGDGGISFCATNASGGVGAWRYRTRPGGKPMQVIYTAALDRPSYGSIAILYASSSMRTIVLGRSGVRADSIGGGFWALYIPGNFETPISEATSRFDIGIATGVDPVGHVVAYTREAIALHLESLREHGEAVPPPTSRVGSVQVA